MNFIVHDTQYKCSKCGAIDRFFTRYYNYGSSYKECADCGHSNKPPDEYIYNGYSNCTQSAPRIVEF